MTPEEYPRNEHNSEGPGFTLADFINSWAKRWKMFAFIVVVFLVAGTVQFKSRPLLPFVHRTAFEVGTKGDGTLIESLPSVKAKLEGAYIPEVLARHAKEEGYSDARYGVKINGEEEEVKGKNQEDTSNTLVIESTGGESATPALLEIHNRIAKRLIDDHATQAVRQKRELAQEKVRAEHKLDEFQEAEAFLPRKRELIDERIALVRRQIAATEDLVNTTEKDRSRALISAATKENIDQSLATTFLLLDSTMASHRDKLRALEEDLFVKLPQERAAIDQEVTQLKRSQIEQQQIVDNIAFQIDNFRSTTISLEPSRLPRLPLSGVLYQTLAIFGGIGFVLGLFMVAFVEFASQARKQARGR
ncbi:hypothetical protein A3B21_04130 [Candidatus Uhrbacteria bacterium RIFCSPLOWO2_01_FULL_47_24]|uniref:Polysaccharide chain length determinant N-terminal domain-containing protein n=1 Tax=Candidatus Uhrbacteria bacterium RIFCSPLOWO2_01_FULL_47_24 TaxID=1802401 RepID=A0A1F7UTJ8_9BACT|nr:MAG: hypothetical protein A2753_02445 [Candidatus Uhrbacteria bacterium RIFCSPHIGHO2_01_FULL_47_11]OGL68774.1 MAG: hypothetical protein A3D58_01335 [Candidatus Uhrbacteria bacterium RIFCSPHIGHO2_02_FULL_46_47]OGL76798.1 MAG: hypothetical protein A3F52_01875 [Candidatus Uhrbacteria bacterium RIFCSPHIGHO2_12_FULL_47_11]OGL81579.1 MAG: hypothetical protein A3B21_04130 [Candidatus Uhrbacteria bacterium RIFCSPLOWO2_01_FULL_47_24]OGL83961.1 MAG: hypothetical protein A3J03_00895 [Candidatus Uhrbact